MTQPPAVPSPSVYPRRAHEIDFRIHGDDMQFVEVDLDPGETVVSEAGAMLFMTDGVQMETRFGDPSSEDTGILGKFLSAGKRLLARESLFLTTYTASRAAVETVAFAAPYPGKIVAADLRELGGTLLCQKDSFLCAAKGVTVGIAFTKKLGAGFFGGEGFILQKLEGDGLAFLHAGGTITKRTLAPGERLKVDTGCLVGFNPSVGYDIEFVGGLKNTFFGGEGLFLATMTGPGEVWLQSLPLSRLATRIAGAFVRRKGEGSVLGGLGNLLDGRE
ncbi:MAG: TIGR00266 family protein [Planctomycetes bacterium]|nr:TIGR00266 family protein [Planctomycetota bacterium]MBL7009408.1 TIGR00266 family protein [Planctomycetota bacterium]